MQVKVIVAERDDINSAAYLQDVANLSVDLDSSEDDVNVRPQHPFFTPRHTHARTPPHSDQSTGPQAANGPRLKPLPSPSQVPAGTPRYRSPISPGGSPADYARMAYEPSASVSLSAPQLCPSPLSRRLPPFFSRTPPRPSFGSLLSSPSSPLRPARRFRA